MKASYHCIYCLALNPYSIVDYTNTFPVEFITLIGLKLLGSSQSGLLGFYRFFGTLTLAIIHVDGAQNRFRLALSIFITVAAIKDREFAITSIPKPSIPGAVSLRNRLYNHCAQLTVCNCMNCIIVQASQELFDLCGHSHVTWLQQLAIREKEFSIIMATKHLSLHDVLMINVMYWGQR